MKKIVAVLCMILALLMTSSCTISIKPIEPVPSKQVESKEEEKKESVLGLEPDEIRPKLWKVEAKDGKSGTLYLFGSIHVGVPEFFPLDDRIEKAYEESDAVAVEVDVISMEYGVGNIDEQYQEYLMYHDGTALPDHISTETYQAVGNFLRENHISIYPYLMYKPYVLSEIVSSVKQSLVDKEAPFSSDYGIDRHYLTRAKLDGKQVLEVEDSSERMSLYGNYSDEVQEYLLVSALLSDSDDYDGTLELLKEWAQGDLSSTAADNDYDQSEEYKKLDEFNKRIYDEYNKAMMTDRNEIMLKKAEEYLNKDMNVMYIVGCAHMVGQNGLVNQLMGRGWKVTEID